MMDNLLPLLSGYKGEENETESCEDTMGNEEREKARSRARRVSLSPLKLARS